MECIILAGGLGTRLQSVVADVPKCMALVAGKPFLHHLLTSLEASGFTRIILALGYKHEVVEAWLQTFSSGMELVFVIENAPLGTGGAVKLALQQAKEEVVFVLNGDTFFGIDYAEMHQQYQQKKADASIALRRMYDFDRYGVVEIDAVTHRILRFQEKKPCAEGLINGGIYLIRKEALTQLPDRFSLEKEYFEAHVASSVITGYPSEHYFIDIGIPEDYRQAQTDFADGKNNTL